MGYKVWMIKVHLCWEKILISSLGCRGYLFSLVRSSSPSFLLVLAKVELLFLVLKLSSLYIDTNPLSSLTPLDSAIFATLPRFCGSIFTNTSQYTGFSMKELRFLVKLWFTTTGGGNWIEGGLFSLIIEIGVLVLQLIESWTMKLPDRGGKILLILEACEMTGGAGNYCVSRTRAPNTAVSFLSGVFLLLHRPCPNLQILPSLSQISQGCCLEQSSEKQSLQQWQQGFSVISNLNINFIPSPSFDGLSGPFQDLFGALDGWIIQLMSDQEQEHVEPQEEEQGEREGVLEENQGEVPAEETEPQVEEAEPQPPSKTEEEVQEELRKQEQETKQRQQEARQKAEEDRLKAEEDTKKLDEALKSGLTRIGKSIDGGSMVYSSLSIADKEIQRLFPIIYQYKNVRHLDISSNSIVDIGLLTELKDLVSLNASKNQISSLQTFSNPNSYRKLQILNLSGNKVKVLENIEAPQLLRLNLSENEIDSITWKGHPNIAYLEMRKNKLRKLEGLSNMPHLVELYLSENDISDFRGLRNLPKLTRLYLRANKIKKILNPFPFLPSLQHLNLRQNLIGYAEDINKVDKHIKSINILQNPITEELGESLKKDFSCIYPQIQTINKSLVTPEERKEYDREYKEKIAEKERERLEKQAEEDEARRLEEESRRLEEQETRNQEEQQRHEQNQNGDSPGDIEEPAMTEEQEQ